MAASYRHAIRWIAINDEPGESGESDVYNVESQISTLLVADIFGKEPEAVAKAILAVRKKESI